MTPVRRFVLTQFSISILAVVALLLAACAPAAPQALATQVPVTGNNVPVATDTPASSIPESVTPAVKVSDQPITSGAVTVDQVDSPGPGWIVIHINSAGGPGQIIGWSPVKAGVNSKVPVSIDASKATSVLYAMLHVDAGQVGTYEFPGPDKPVTFNGQMVSPAFAATSGAGAPDAGGATAAATAPAAPAATNTTAASSGGYGSATDTPAAGQAAAAGQASRQPGDERQAGPDPGRQ